METNQKSQNREKYWRHHIEEWKRSGLSQDKYCQQLGLSKYTFGYWNQKIRKGIKSKALVPVSIIPEISPPDLSQQSGISVTIKNRFTINLDNKFNSSTLTELITILETQ